MMNRPLWAIAALLMLVGCGGTVLPGADGYWPDAHVEVFNRQEGGCPGGVSMTLRIDGQELSTVEHYQRFVTKDHFFRAGAAFTLDGACLGNTGQTLASKRLTGFIPKGVTSGPGNIFNPNLPYWLGFYVGSSRGRCNTPDAATGELLICMDQVTNGR